LKIGVTGGSGFIGSRLVKKLVERGYDVTSIDMNDPADLAKNYTYVQCDLLDYSSAKSALHGFDVLYHLAGCVLESVRKDPYVGSATNVDITRNVIEACCVNKIEKVLFASSFYVYDGISDRMPETHSVVEVTQGDKRFDIANACAGQGWAADAPAIFPIVYNSSHNNGNTGDGGALPHLFMEVNAGAVIQQLLLEASAWNLSTNIITQGLEEWNGTGAEELRSILGMSPSLIPLYIVPVGAQAIDKTPPTISTPSQNPDFTSVEPHQNVTVTVDVIDEGVGVREVTLSYTIDGGQTWTNTTMNNISDNTYMGKIPGFQADTHVQYKIIAYDKANNPAVEDKNEKYYIYTVISEFTTIMFLLILIFSSITISIAKKKIPKNKK